MSEDNVKADQTSAPALPRGAGVLLVGWRDASEGNKMHTRAFLVERKNLYSPSTEKEAMDVLKTAGVTASQWHFQYVKYPADVAQDLKDNMVSLWKECAWPVGTTEKLPPAQPDRKLLRDPKEEIWVVVKGGAAAQMTVGEFMSRTQPDNAKVMNHDQSGGWRSPEEFLFGA